MLNSEERGSLVVTGSSAGGIEALSVVLSTLPANFGAPIVVAQHLDPSVPSSLAAILSKHTQLNVVAVSATTELRRGTVYVVPSDRNVEITDGSVQILTDDGPRRPKPSIDLLFTSAAESFGDRLIAVVLTGMGSDGSSGARVVKQHGGTIIIEDPLTASFPSMPASLEVGMVDLIAPLDRIGAELIRLVDETVDVPDDLPLFDELLQRVRACNGIDFSHYKSGTIKRRLVRQMMLGGYDSIENYLQFLADDPAEFARLSANFLIKVTEFFRDRETFEELGNSIIPELVDEARNRSGFELRIWSAGCATGEEAYSLAILVAEAVRSRPGALNVRIFATDIDEAAVSFGRRGIYPHKILEAIEPELLERYFTATPSGWEVVKSLRDMTVFGQHDLAQRPPFPRIDLAVCRNVLIYFSKKLQRRTLGVFAFSLRTGGYLAIGKSETASPLAEYFAVVNPALRIFRRNGERVAIPSAQPQKPVGKPREAERPQRPFPAFAPDTAQGRQTLSEKLGAFLTNSSIGVILVDRHYDILSINASARSMFNLHGVAIAEDLVHLAPPNTSSTIRTMLDSALRNQQPTAGGEEIEVNLDGTDARRCLTLSCYPEVAAGGNVTGAVILAVDVTDIADSRRKSLQAVDAQTREIDQLRKSETYGRERQRSLVEANQQLAHVNSELRSQNDSLIINAEEAAAATEEIETLNEEMQATNEELETLNEEFQATIEELNTTNDEYEARGQDLENSLNIATAQRRAAESQAAALTSVIDSSPGAIAAVDAQGAVLVANRRFREIQDDETDSSVQIDDDAGARISLSVVLRRAGEGQAFSFTYRAIASNQALTIYSGKVRPIAQSLGAQSIIELLPAT